jgi:hypothetical protein
VAVKCRFGLAKIKEGRMIILHVSDLHIGKSRHRTKQAEKLLDKIDKAYQVSDKANHSYLLVTGDIVDIGTKQNFEDAVDILGPFKDKLLLVPGNHDCSGEPSKVMKIVSKLFFLKLIFRLLRVIPVIPGVFYNENSAKGFDDMLHSGFGIPHAFFSQPNPFCWSLSDGANTEVEVFGVNSCGKLEIGSSLGLVGHQQLTSLDTDLNKNPEIPKIVCFHHRPGEVDIPFFMKLQDGEDLIDIAKNRGVGVIAFGHEGPMELVEKKQRAKFAKRGMDMNIIQTSAGKEMYLIDADKSVPLQTWWKIIVKPGQITKPTKET